MFEALRRGPVENAGQHGSVEAIPDESPGRKGAAVAADLVGRKDAAPRGGGVDANVRKVRPRRAMLRKLHLSDRLVLVSTSLHWRRAGFCLHLPGVGIGDTTNPR